MLTPSEYDHLCDRLMVIYNDLENSIINDMVRRITRMGRVSEATVWQAKQLQESGMLFDDILAEIAKRSDATENQVRALFQDAGIQSIQNDNYFYEQAGFGSITKLSPAAAQVLEAGYAKCSGELKNLTLTTAISSQQMYISACDSAYMQVSSGAMDYGTAIRRAVQAAADGGAYVWYPSGHKDRLDVAVRRSVLTGVGQTVRQLSVTNASDMGADLMEITAHAGARPEHAEWQGKLVSLSGKNAGRYIDGAKVYSLKEIGYGSGDGFGGWNCRHDWFPFFEGVSSRAYSDERLKELNAKNIEYDGKMYTEYEIDQMQRALERDIRDKKRSVSAANAGLDAAIDENVKKQMQGMFDTESVKLKEAEKKLKNFLEKTGQLPDSTRVWVKGFDKSLSQKAVWADKKQFVKAMTEKGFNNPPQSLALFEKMRYNSPKEYDLMKKYIKSVDTGFMSPLVGYDKYKEYHGIIENEIVGTETFNGIKITSQSDHFLERVFGTISDPKHGGVKRSGVELDDIVDVLKNGQARDVKESLDEHGKIVKSQALYSSKCIVSINPDTGVIIQCNPI